MVLDAWSLPLDAYMTLLPLMVLKEPHNCINLLEAWTRCTRASSATAEYNSANDLILIPAGIFFSAHRSKHLKLICPSKRGNLCIGYPEAAPGMLHQFF